MSYYYLSNPSFFLHFGESPAFASHPELEILNFL